jgi:hypothetical protein
LKKIPKTENAPVLRTDFSDEPAWEAIGAAIQTPVDGYQAYVDFLSDRDYDGLTAEQVTRLPREDPDQTFLFVVDQTTLSHPDHPILVIDLIEDPGRTFRVTPVEMAAVENNLSIANMDFAEFVDHVDPDGIFRGFPGS